MRRITVPDTATLISVIAIVTTLETLAITVNTFVTQAKKTWMETVLVTCVTTIKTETVSECMHACISLTRFSSTRYSKQP